jgi:hypothetical protein
MRREYPIERWNDWKNGGKSKQYEVFPTLIKCRPVGSCKTWCQKWQFQIHRKSNALLMIF